eukprot:s772_g19.t1
MAKSFLEQPRSISLRGLALLLIDTPTTKLIQESGLTPMVFPAFCVTSEEHTIIMGHILQLGDSTVKRKMAGKESVPDTIDTQVIKFPIYKDQLTASWQDFVMAPVRHLVQMVEALQLCKGQQCGVHCAKHHSGIDETLDAVLLEVWSRMFLDENGKRVSPSGSVHFTVFVRIPESALLKILTSLPDGIYAEPRGAQPREQDDKFRVIWLPGADYSEAQHLCKTFAQSLCLVRLRHKYGIRVRKSDEAAAWGKLRPGVDFVDMTIQRIYELFPIPHTTQRPALTTISNDWGWKARVLQPGKGNFHHMAWRVGAMDPPPASIMTAFGADVIITQVKDLQVQESKPKIYATAKTQKQLREQPSQAASSRPASAQDPWADQAQDPWGGYSKKINPSPAAPSSHKAEIQDMINTGIQSALKAKSTDMMDDDGNDYTTENELRFVALESGMSELKQQNGQFLQWFQQTGERLQRNETAMQDIQTNVQNHAGALQTMTSAVNNAEKAISEVHQTLNTHQQELHSIGSNFQTAMRSMKDEITGDMTQSFNQQFTKLEALLEKRHKTN